MGIHIETGTSAFWGDQLGRVTRWEGHRNLWWVGQGDTEIMFSQRADGEWRAFPGSASAPGLVFVENKVLTSV